MGSLTLRQLFLCWTQQFLTNQSRWLIFKGLKVPYTRTRNELLTVGSRCRQVQLWPRSSLLLDKSLTSTTIPYLLKALSLWQIKIISTRVAWAHLHWPEQLRLQKAKWGLNLIRALIIPKWKLKWLKASWRQIKVKLNLNISTCPLKVTQLNKSQPWAVHPF
jgi:hypothetical protein